MAPHSDKHSAEWDPEATRYADEGTGDLAVARAVEEEEDFGLEYVASAIEYDPDAKPAIHKNRRFKYDATTFGLLLIAGVVVGVMVPLLVGGGDEGYSGPTMAPTTLRDSLGIRDQIETTIGSSKLEDETLAQAKALEWILYDDPMQLTPEDETLLQRYIMAYFYLQTSQEGPWRSCNPPQAKWKETSKCDFQQMVTVNPSQFAIKYNETRWLSDAHECEWVGVTCSGQRVTAIELIHVELTGPFPEELAHLPFLRYIDFSWNELSGPFPSTISDKMRLLDDIQLHSNKFTGTIPPELFSFENNLRQVNLGGNPLSGSLVIPGDKPIKSLTELYLFETQLTGTLPTEIGLISNLRNFRINKVPKLTGTIPTEIAQLSYLKDFRVPKTQISGTIPSELGLLTGLLQFRFSYTRMIGTIPDEIYNMSSLSHFDLYDSNFTGTISPLIGKLSNLETFRVRFTNLEGPIPSQLGSLQNLEKVWLHHTKLTGEVPDGVCTNSRSLSELSADCYPGSETLPGVNCTCCTSCCSQDTLICETTDLGFL